MSFEDTTSMQDVIDRLTQSRSRIQALLERL